MANYVSNFELLGEEIQIKDIESRNSIAEINSDISTINSDISTINSDISALKLSKLAGKNIVFFGDSWTVGSGATSTSQGFAPVMANRLDMTQFNYGVGGAGFLRSGNQIITQVNTANSDMSSTEKNNTAIVFIFGGVNDWRNSTGSIDSMATAIKTVCDTCHNQYKNAKIVVALCNTMNLNITDTFRHWMYYFRYYLQQNCAYPIQIIKNVENIISGRSGCYVSDNLHPSTTGHAILAGFFINQLLGGDSTVDYYHSTFTLSSGNTMTQIPHLFRFNNKICCTGGTFTLGSAISSNTRIGTMSTLISPKYTTYIPAFYANRLIGNIALTESGNVYCSTINASTSSSVFNFPDFSYVFGKND